MKMRTQKLLILALMTFAICVPATQVQAEDWPDWVGAKRDAVWRETGIVKKFPEGGPKIVWRQPVGIGYTGPSVSEGHVYLMDFVTAPKDDSDGKRADGKTDQEKKKRPAGIRGIKGTERVFCLSAKTGKLVWEHKYDETLAISYPNGPRCTPIVSGDKVYALGAMGQLTCFNKKDGKIVWEKNLPKEYETKPPIWGYASHPLIDGDTMYCTVGGDDSAVVAFNKHDGKEIWSSQTTFDIAYVPLVLFGEGENKQLIMWNGDGLVSLNSRTGKKNWSENLRDANPQPQATCIAMPQIIGDKLFVSDYYLGSMLVQLDKEPTRHKVLWRTTKEQLRGGTHLNAMMMTPFVADGHAYGVGVNGRGGGHLMCVNVKDGEKVWSETKPLGEGRLMFANLFIVKNEDRYFLCNDQGELIIANLSAKGYEEIDRAKVLEPTHKARGRTVVWSHPAFANGRMYARNDKEIVCVELSESAYKK